MSSANVIFTVMFIDAGPTRSAWVIVDVWSNGTIIPRQGGWRSMRDATWLGALMESVWATGGVVCLEYIEGALYSPDRWRDLGETMRVEGDIRTVARIHGADHVLLPFREMPSHRAATQRALFCVPAPSWRKLLCHRGNATDAEIAVLVLELAGREVEYAPGKRHKIIDLPAARDDEAREHVYDAIGGALAMVEVFLGVKLRVSDSTRAAQEKARSDAGRKKAIHAKLEALGVPIDRAKMADGSPVAKKRKPSRGVRAGRRAVSLNSRDINKRASR